MDKDNYVEIRFGDYRDYRIVRMADAQGNMREGIFIPFIQNGIRWNKEKYRSPIQYLKPFWAGGVDPRKLYKLVPVVSVDIRRQMEEAGVLSPDDKYPCDLVGYICKDNRVM